MGSGVSTEGGSSFEEQFKAKWTELDPEGKGAVNRAECWAALHADESIASLVGGGDVEKGKAMLKSMQSARVLDTNFDGAVTLDELKNLAKPEVLAAAEAAVAAAASGEAVVVLETMPTTAKMVELGFTEASLPAFIAAFKASAGGRDWTSWTTEQWVEAGGEGGFDGSKVKASEIPFLFFNASEEDSIKLQALAQQSWGLDEKEAAGFFNFIYRVSFMVLQAGIGSGDVGAPPQDEAWAATKVAVETALGKSFTAFESPVRDAAFKSDGEELGAEA